jgi:hypothetical protein
VAKEPKYTVEKSESPTLDGKPYWMIWINDNDVIFWDEKTADQVCEALNIADRMRKITRKARELASALEYFNSDD